MITIKIKDAETPFAIECAMNQLITDYPYSKGGIKYQYDADGFGAVITTGDLDAIEFILGALADNDLEHEPFKVPCDECHGEGTIEEMNCRNWSNECCGGCYVDKPCEASGCDEGYIWYVDYAPEI